jgi:hypothetical protein
MGVVVWHWYMLFFGATVYDLEPEVAEFMRNVYDVIELPRTCL